MIIKLLQFGLMAVISMAMTLFSYAQSPLDAVAQSHIDGNIPDKANFAEFLERDLNAYFSKLICKPVVVDYELLRDGPTQTGISYPKYYAWVKAIEDNQTLSEGAVRLAAIAKKRFEITHFLSIIEMKRNPESVFRVFPRSIGEQIALRLK